MRGRKCLYPKNNELNINVDDNSYRNGSTPLESSRQILSHRQKAFPIQVFQKNIDKMDKENSNSFSNATNKKKKVFEHSDFNSNLKKEDDNYIKNLRGAIKNNLFKKDKGADKFDNEKNHNSINKANHLTVKTHFIDLENFDEKQFVFQKFKENFLFDLKNFKKLMGYLNFLDILNFQYVCKQTFSFDFKSVIKRLVCKALVQGITKKQQYQYYDYFIHFKTIKLKFSTQFRLNLEKPSLVLKDIQKDIDRTYHCSKHLSSLEKQNQLKKVLIAVANTDKEVGYIQGLNVFVSTFILNDICEHDVYWIAKYFLKKMKLKDVMKNNFPKLKLLTYQMDVFLFNYIPEIRDHLEKQGISISYFTYPWFLTLFAYEIPLNLLNIVWNLFLIKGWKIIIQCGLALLSVFKDEIMKQGADDLGDFLRCFFAHFSIKKEKQFLIKILKFKVTNRLMVSLESIYNEGKTELVHLKKSNSKKKLEWDLTPFYEEMTDTALKSYLKHASITCNTHKKQMAENLKNTKNFFSNFPNIVKEIFGFEKKTNTNYGIVEEGESPEADIHRKMEFLKNEGHEPFIRKPKIIEKNQFHLALIKEIPDFVQVNPIYLNSETDIPETESVLS